MATTTTTPDPNADRVAPFADLNSAKLQATTPPPVFRFRQSIFADPSVETTTIAVFNQPIVTSPPTTTPAPTTTTTTLPPSITLNNARILGHELGSVVNPKKGSGGISDSYNNTKGSVELVSVGIDKEINGPLTYEVYDFFTDKNNSDPIVSATGETSVTNWDEETKTGVILINETIECKADPGSDDGSMDLQVIIRDSNLNTLFHFINIEQPPITETEREEFTTYVEEVVESTKSDLDDIIPDGSRVVIKGPDVPIGDDEEVIIVDQKDISIDVNSEDNLSVDKDTLDKILNDNAVVVAKPTITTTTTTKQPNDFDGQSTYRDELVTPVEEVVKKTYVVVVEPKSPIPVTPPPTTTTPRLTNPFINPNIPTTTTLPVDDTPIIVDEGTFEDRFGTTLSVTAQPPPPPVVTVPPTTTPSPTTTTQGPFPGLVYTTRPPVTVPPTTTTTTTTIAPLGSTDSTISIDGRQPDPPINLDPKLSVPADGSTTRQPVTTPPLPGTVTTPNLNDSIKDVFSGDIDEETKSEVDNLVEISKTTSVDVAKIITTPPVADGSTTRQPMVTPPPVTTTPSPIEGTTVDIGARQPDPVVTTTTTTLPVAVITTPPPPELPPNTVTNQEELIEAINTYSEVLITESFTVNTIIEIPENTAIIGFGNPTITMSNTIVAFNIRTSNVELRDFTISSEKNVEYSRGIGINITRAAPTSLVSVENVTISNITFNNIGDPNKDKYGAIAVRGYNTAQSNPDVNPWIPRLLAGASNFRNIVIRDCTFNNIPNNAIDFWMVTDGVIFNNTVNTTTSQKWHYGNGIRAQDLISTLVSQNTFNRIARMGIEILGNCSQVTVSDNNITGSGNMTGPFTAGISISQGVYNSKVINNRVNNSSNGYEIAEASSNIILANNTSNFIRNKALSISSLANNLYIHDNNWSNTFGPEEVAITQSWNILYENNNSTNHNFVIGPGTRPKRGILASQSNNIKIYDNKFESDYFVTDSESSAIYFYLSFIDDPTVNGERVYINTDPSFPWTQFFRGTGARPGIRGGSRGLEYARLIKDSSWFNYSLPGLGVLASGEPWDYIPNSIENNTTNGSLVTYRNNNSQVQELDVEEVVTTPPPPNVTTTTTSTTTTTTTLRVTTPPLVDPRVPTTTPSLVTTLVPTTLRPSDTFTVDGSTTRQPRVTPPPVTTPFPVDGSTTLPPVVTPSPTTKPPVVTPAPRYTTQPPTTQPPTTPPLLTTTPPTTPPPTTLGPELSVFPGPIIILDPIDPDYGYVPPVVELPPPWWWWPKLPWIPPDILPPLTGDFPFYYLTGGPLQGFVPTKCIEPPEDPVTETPEVDLDPEDPIIVPPVLPPEERCIYPAPILPLEKNFYAEIDIIQPTSLLSPSDIFQTTPPPTSFVDEVVNFPVTNEELAEDVDCDSTDDCNNLSY